MKVVAYSIKNFEKELLAKANQKKHDITLISNPLNLQTALYAKGKDAVLVFPTDDVSVAVIEQLAAMGIRHIATRSVETDHIDREAAAEHQIKLANVPNYSPQAIAEYTVTMALALSRKLMTNFNPPPLDDDTAAQHVGFNFSGKTVGIIGLGKIGKAVATIFNGLGCRILAFDNHLQKHVPHVKSVNLDQLLAEADIISLHIPLNPDTRHLINREALSKMKDGVMLINTSRGAIIQTEAIIEGLAQGKVGYLGMDAYETEKGVQFHHQPGTTTQYPLLEKLLSFPNVMITPHRAFLTREALQEAAVQTIRNLDNWQKNLCVGEACACAKSCVTDVDKVKSVI